MAILILRIAGPRVICRIEVKQMRNSISCRKACKEDLSVVLRLYAQPEMDDGEVLSLSEAERLFERFASYPDYHLYVAVCNGQVVGTFELLIMDNLGHLGARSAVIEDVVVDPQWQKNGVGKTMMRHALRICSQKGCYKAVLSSNLKRNGAHSFYKSLGFELHGYSFRTGVQPAMI